jgi:hypothetical protein
MKIQYRMIVKIKNLPENLILDGLDSNSIGKLLIEAHEYLCDIGYPEYKIESINRVTKKTFVVTFDDINLN